MAVVVSATVKGSNPQLGPRGAERMAHPHNQHARAHAANLMLGHQCPPSNFQCPCCGRCNSPFSGRNQSVPGGVWRECTW